MSSFNRVLSIVDQGLQEVPFEIINAAEGPDEDFSNFPSAAFEDITPQITSVLAPSTLFDFSVSVLNDAGADFDAFIPIVADVAAAAVANWAALIVGAPGSQIDVAVTIADLGPGTVASASAGGFFLGAVLPNGVQEILTGTQIELIAGVDPNGAAPDIVINVSTAFLQDPGAFFSTDPDRVVPADALDFVSVLTHEVTHGLGFIALRDNTGEDLIFDFGNGPVVAETTYGTFVDFTDNGDPFLTPTFNGANTVEVYGEPVVLESTFNSGASDVSHYALFNPDGSIADTALAIENPTVIRSDLVTIGAIELATLRDLFYTTAGPADLPLLNRFDPLPFDPTVSVEPGLTVQDGQVFVTVTLDQPSLFLSLPTSVGVEITSPDGSSQTLRARFAPGETVAQVALNGDLLDDLGNGAESVDVRIFYPAQAILANGNVEETVTLAAEGVSGGDGDDRLNGTNGDDQIFGGGGNDRLNGGNGNDALFGNSGDDTLNGGNGNDSLNGGSGNDRINGSNGDDLLAGGEGDNVLNSGNGNDTVTAGSGRDVINSGNGNDEIDAGDGINVINSGNGDDSLLSGSGDDTINSGNGDDILATGGGNDLIRAGNGNDIIDSGAGDDTIFASNGDDFIAAGGGNDRIYSGNGEDILFFSADDGSGETDVRDFRDNSDLLVFDNFGFEALEDLLANAEEVGRDLVITLNALGDLSVRLRNTDLDELTEDNVLFLNAPPPEPTAEAATMFTEDDVTQLRSQAASIIDGPQVTSFANTVDQDLSSEFTRFGDIDFFQF